MRQAGGIRRPNNGGSNKAYIILTGTNTTMAIKNIQRYKKDLEVCIGLQHIIVKINSLKPTDLGKHSIG
jgi:hypothetical protein